MMPRLPLDKIQPVSRIGPILAELKGLRKKTVMTNGCFDLIHPGHIRYLIRARSQGDLLLVALNSDASVKLLKGTGRPIFPVQERCEIVASLQCVDLVTVFEEETPARLIRSLLPDVLVKGGDWPLDRIVGRPEVEKAGGRVISIPFEEGYSSTMLIDKIHKSASLVRTPSE